MDAIRVRNLRSFGDSVTNAELPYVDLKPLTIFVGKNSCGKSTLLRSLPVLKQSASNKVITPILWFGDLVDFGSFTTALHRNAENEKIYFDYKFNMKLNVGGLESRHTGRFVRQDSMDIELKHGFVESENQTKFDTVTINFEKTKLKIKIIENNIYDIYINNEKLLDKVKLTTRKSNLALEIIDEKALEFGFSIFDNLYITDIRKEYIDSLFKLTTKRMKESSIVNIIDNIGICSFSCYLTLLQTSFSQSKSFKKSWDSTRGVDKYGLYELHMATFLPLVLKRCSNKLNEFSSEIRYIGPVRAVGERFSRHQGLYVNEIDPTGINVATFLSRLSVNEQEELNEWTNENFNFVVRTESDGLHHELKIKCQGDDEENITDMGSGFAQVLPIVVSLWIETQQNSSDIFESRNRTFVIEQPELHLHPEYQHLLIRTFMKVINLTKEHFEIKIILETHSKTIIDAISDAIEDEEFDSNLASINIFNKVDKKTQIKKSYFDPEGRLRDWPIGFLSGR